MHEPAVVGIERFGLQGFAALLHQVGDGAHFFDQAVVAHGAPVLDVDGDPRGLRVAGLEEAVEKVLDVLERFVVATGQQVGIARVDLQDKPVFVGLLLDLHGETEVAEHGIEDLFRGHVPDLRFFPLPASSAFFWATAFFSSTGSGLLRVA